jgi:hypothetical protein
MKTSQSLPRPDFLTQPFSRLPATAAKVATLFKDVAVCTQKNRDHKLDRGNRPRDCENEQHKMVVYQGEEILPIGEHAASLSSSAQERNESVLHSDNERTT